jgi:hypothetical protein
MSLSRFSFRHASASLGWHALLLPALALGIVAVAWARRSPPELPMPRLPVRRKPQVPRSGVAPRANANRLRRLQTRAPEVVLPMAFWDAEEEVDDPAEIPGMSCRL